MIAHVLAGMAVAGMLATAPAAASQPPGGHVQFRLSDPRLAEVSGIAAGIRSPGVVYVENDGGDFARFFALDARTGVVRAAYTVPGAQNVDWEDIAVAPDAAGTPSVWLADIGDNDAQRAQIEIYRVDEPAVNTSTADVAARTDRPDVWSLTYPDGPHNAESLAVSPAGVPYIVTKSLLGASEVYAARSSPGRAELRRIGSFRFHRTDTPGPFAPIGQLMATGADLSRDGRSFVVRTYTDAYLWRVDGDLSSALRATPTRIPLPDQPQGEGICFSRDHLLIDSEQVGSAVYAVPLPAPVTRTPAPAPRSSHPAPTIASTPAATDARDDGIGGWGWVAGGVGAGVLVVIVFGWRRRAAAGATPRTRADPR